MTDKKPAYTVRVAETDGAICYYATFVDGNGTLQEVEINREIYLALEDCRLIEKGQENERGRHWERFRLSEGQLAARTLRPQRPMEEAVTLTADMQSALSTLTDTQRRRFLLYHEHELDFSQIAHIEGCYHSAVIKSISAAQDKLKKYFSEGGVKTGV